MPNYSPKIIAVSLNPSVDRGIEVSNFTLGAHQTGRLLFRRPAGKAVNLAHTLGTLKVPTALIGWVGKGQQDYFERYLNDVDVACQLFPVEGQTRENITIVDPVNRIETHIRDRGFDVTGDDVGRLREALAGACGRDSYVVFSGSLPPGLALDGFVELVRICQENGAKVCLDAGGTVLRACLPLGVWLMKPNTLELSEMLDTPVETPGQILAAGRRLAQEVAVAVITRGKDGAVLLSASETLQARVQLDPTEVKNTVGCGDAFLAGFLSKVSVGVGLKESFAFALAMGTAAAVSVTPGDIGLGDVHRFLRAVENGDPTSGNR